MTPDNETIGLLMAVTWLVITGYSVAQISKSEEPMLSFRVAINHLIAGIALLALAAIGISTTPPEWEQGWEVVGIIAQLPLWLLARRSYRRQQ